ncbi:hypothetical protein F2Q69_00015454 [Brassica cretica]|uniref:Replication factor A C-terminal domain-containing protein n=1 Tax=Brassica cretica TaxID=69181 RepID=A0A8S9QPB8_BRACR|nr:hypothetical protein F2Q69_00015454 [Brassica cretica]
MCCLQESMIVALSVHRIHQDPNCSYSSIHPIASRKVKTQVFVKLGCVSPDIIGVIRVRAELAVDDRKDCATFVVFNKELTKLIKQDAATLALEEMSGGGGQDLPRCLEDLAGKDYIFQIRVTPCRFIPNQCTFTVSAISDDIFFGGEGGQPTTAASYTVDAAKRAMGVDEAHPPDFEDKEKAANAPVFAY